MVLTPGFKKLRRQQWKLSAPKTSMLYHYMSIKKRSAVRHHEELLFYIHSLWVNSNRWLFCVSRSILKKDKATVFPLQQSHHVSGEQNQPGDWNVSDGIPRPPGQEQPQVTEGGGRELRGTMSAGGHLGEARHPEAAAVCRTMRHPHWGLRPHSTRGRVTTVFSWSFMNYIHHWRGKIL